MSRLLKCLPRAALVALFALAGAFSLAACDGGSDDSQQQQAPPVQQ